MTKDFSAIEDIKIQMIRSLENKRPMEASCSEKVRRSQKQSEAVKSSQKKLKAVRSSVKQSEAAKKSYDTHPSDTIEPDLS
mmetsp:Transcript_27825/g.42387  ORF Transcript_27825/g.42387 Transcript_27825/m.42387 type:complete len:81 (-) Transcript_27825:504-746(-)